VFTMLKFVTASKRFFIDLTKENKKAVRDGLLCTAFPILKGGWFVCLDDRLLSTPFPLFSPREGR
jgi:hypothetical protein